MSRPISITLLSIVLLLPGAAHAQIPMPSGISLEHSTTGRRPSRRVSPVKRAEAKVAALKAQLAAIKELRNWAETSSKELSKIHGDSLANLMQARAAIFRAKGKAAPRYQVPSTFEVEPVRVGTGTQYPSSSYNVPVVPPDNFRLFTRVTFPDRWVRERKKVQVSFQIYPDRYLPMASRYQNTTKAIYRIYSYSQKVNRKVTTFNATVRGLALQPGRYFVSFVVSTKGYPTQFLVSLGLFRVERPPPEAVAVNLPHYRRWYGTYKPVIRLDKVKASMRGTAIHLGGSYTRRNFEKGQEPVYLELSAKSSSIRRKVLLRQRRALKRARQNIRGKTFVIKDHGLPPGSYTLYVSAYTEYPAGSSKYSYMRGSRAEKKFEITVPGR